MTSVICCWCCCFYFYILFKSVLFSANFILHQNRKALDIALHTVHSSNRLFCVSVWSSIFRENNIASKTCTLFWIKNIVVFSWRLFGSEQVSEVGGVELIVHFYSTLFVVRMLFGSVQPVNTYGTVVICFT